MLRFCSVNFLHSLGCLNPFGQTTSHIFVLVSAVSAVWTAGQSVLLDVIMVDKTWSCFSVGSVEEKWHSALMGSNIAWPTCMSGDIKMWRKKGRFSGSICKPPLNWGAEIALINARKWPITRTARERRLKILKLLLKKQECWQVCTCIPLHFWIINSSICVLITDVWCFISESRSKTMLFLTEVWLFHHECITTFSPCSISSTSSYCTS